jgi:ABC-type Fe3+-hydroxamate transport system substrate-binding protein
MRERLLFPAIVAVVALAIAGCSSSTSDVADKGDGGEGGDSGERAGPVKFPLTIEDAAGNKHTFKKPAKVGCLWYGCTEDFADLGIAPEAAGVSASELKSAFLFPVGPPAHRVGDTTSVENWAKTDVDTIVTIVNDNPEFDALEQAAPLFRYHYPIEPTTVSGIDSLKENLRLLGQITDHADEAEAAVERYDDVIAKIAAAAPPEAADRKIALLYASNDDSYLMPASAHQELLCDGIEEAGLGTCIDSTKTGEINAEQFLAEDPDWIVYSGEGQSWKERDDSVWKRLTAVKKGQVYDTDNYVVGESLRILEHALQELGNETLPPDSGVEDPGPFFDYNPNAES